MCYFSSYTPVVVIIIIAITMPIHFVAFFFFLYHMSHCLLTGPLLNNSSWLATKQLCRLSCLEVGRSLPINNSRFLLYMPMVYCGRHFLSAHALPLSIDRLPSCPPLLSFYWGRILSFAHFFSTCTRRKHSHLTNVGVCGKQTGETAERVEIQMYLNACVCRWNKSSACPVSAAVQPCCVALAA